MNKLPQMDSINWYILLHQVSIFCLGADTFTEATHTTFLDKLIPDEATLWRDVKENYIRHKCERGLLLVIYQFEELFTYPPESANAFQEQLVETLFKTVPQRY
jgi:hypothetical protein